MLYVPFLFEDSEKRSYGGVAWGVGDIGLDFGGGCCALAVEDIHYLSLTPAEGVFFGQSVLRVVDDAKNLADGE